ncbi:MAG: coiled-coil domain-containing protein mad1 [Bogoriella megaspora]|nr:MAG: coiled-coil domain-containing protein mad1 [Bogoriella megaspora]
MPLGTLLPGSPSTSGGSNAVFGNTQAFYESPVGSMAFRNQQPTYDFLSGAPSPPQPPSRQPLRETLRQSTSAKPGKLYDRSNEDLRAQINALQYELDSIKQERELTALQHQQELRDIQSKSDADFKRAQAAETNGDHASKKYDGLARELQGEKDRAANEKAELERKLRSTQESNRSLTEEVEEARVELESQARGNKYRYDELEAKFTAAQKGLEELREDLNMKVNLLQTTQQRLSQRETEVGEMENEIVRLKAQAGDADTLEVIKRELSDQVAHIRKLEATNRDQIGELKQLRKQSRSVELVEEEKQSLQIRLRAMDDLRKELNETQLQKQLLEDERKSWTSYLENEREEEADLRFQSPEDMARAYVGERLEKASLMEQLGVAKAETAPKDELINRLEEEKVKTLAELEKARSSGSTVSDSKFRTRLERQRTLAVKEVEYLRAQLKNLDSEDTEFQPEKYDAQKSTRIQELEDLVDQWRSEAQSLHTQLSTQEDKERDSPTTGSKRKRTSTSPDPEDEVRTEDLRRKARQLQDDFNAMRTRNAVLEKDLAAQKSQISSLKSDSRTRILELRSNPTSDAEAIKLSTLTRLKEENAVLLERLKTAEEPPPNGTDSNGTSTRKLKSVPWPTYEGAKADNADLQEQLAGKDKKMLRLRQIFTAKSSEFREAVASVLGWKMDFMPNGRVRMTSLLYPGVGDGGEGGEENSIIFDGEKGEMKVSGGPQSAFFGEIRGLIEFWVDGRGTVPGFLAACTLDFWERSTQAVKM